MRTSGDEVERVVNPSEWTHVHSLSSYDSSTSNTGRVFPRSRVDDSLNNNLDGVLVGEKVDNLESVLDDAACQEFLSRVTALTHQAACKTFYNRTGGLAKALLLVATSSVWEIGSMGGGTCDVVLETDILAFNLRETPLSEELGLIAWLDISYRVFLCVPFFKSTIIILKCVHIALKCVHIALKCVHSTTLKCIHTTNGGNLLNLCVCHRLSRLPKTLDLIFTIKWYVHL